MKKHVMLIDPAKDHLQLFMQAFEEVEMDIKCTYAESCTHAAEMLNYIRIDALFVQLDPGIADALEFVRGIKAMRRLKGAPVVVYSATMSYYNFLARGHGADHTMKCPLASADVKKALEELLSWQTSLSGASSV